MSISTPPIGSKNISNSTDSEVNTDKIQSGQESKLPADSNLQAPDTAPKSTTLSKSGAQAKMAEQSLSSFARQSQIVSAPNVAAIPTGTATVGKTIDDQFRDAALKNDTKKMEDLLKKGANVNSKDVNGKTALMLAATSGNRAAMETLVKRYHADVTIKDPKGQTALSQAASLGLNDSVQTLLQYPKVINEVDADGNTPLMNAVKNGHSNVATSLLQKGADASIADDHGRTPLMESVKKGDGRSVRELLRHNPGFDMQDENGKTALMEAIEKGNPALRASYRLTATSLNSSLVILLLYSPCILSGRRPFSFALSISALAQSLGMSSLLCGRTGSAYVLFTVIAMVIIINIKIKPYLLHFLLIRYIILSCDVFL